MTCEAHHLAVMAERLAIATGNDLQVSIFWGHQLPVDELTDAAAIDRYELLSPKQTIKKLETNGRSIHTNQIQVEEAGVYHLIATRKPSLFTVVIDENGQHKHHRGPRSSVDPKQGKVDHSAVSLQFAKTIITSGERGIQPVGPIGLPLEITPVDAPNKWKNSRDVRFRVTFQGKPVADEEVVVSVVGLDKSIDGETDTDKDASSDGTPTMKTDKDGMMTVPSGELGSGIWVLRVRLRQPSESDKQAEYDFDSYTTTLAFEVQP